MKTGRAKNPTGKNIANLSARTRLDSLLFDGAKLGTTLLAPASFLEPKIPPYKGE